MAWIEDLYRTYENNLGEIAKDLDAKALLLPIAHSMQNAQIEICINIDGEFISADVVPKANAVTIIPVTEDSASRGNGILPHPLEDKLEYIAGDYEKYTGVNNDGKFSSYIGLLNAWCDSPYSCEEILAVSKYVNRKSMMEDLISRDILKVENGRLTKENIEGIKQADSFVRFTIYGLSDENNTNAALYKNRKLFDIYSKYYIAKQSETDLCYASGKWIPCSIKHPAKIRHAGDKAKLISANDESGFTYRGRFSDSSQVASVGYEISQKAHNALRWLIAKQGIPIGEADIVAWEISGKDIISIVNDTMDALFGDEEEEYATTNEVYASRLKKAIFSDKEQLDANARIVVMSVEAATTGRLSVSFYKKMDGSDFKGRIRKWHSTCIWKHTYKNWPDGFIGAPSVYDIARAAYGSFNDKLKKVGIERIVHCIIDGRRFPYDMMVSAVERMNKRESFASNSEFRRMLSVTCSMIRKYRYDKSDEKEEWDMALNEKCTNRDYLYGRLLAAAEMLERRALGPDEKGRETAAERYMQRFSKKPGETWKTIYESLNPYISKLNSMGLHYYDREIHKIMDKFEIGDFVSHQALSELYLLGYSCQLCRYKQSNDTENENKEEQA